MKKILILYFIAFTATGAQAQTDWEFKREEEGIKAYTRSREGIKFKEYKVEMTLEATLAQFLALMKDFNSYTDIFPDTKDIKVYHEEPSHHITYIKFDIPFPARDRDAVFDNKLSYDHQKKLLTIAVQCLPEGYPTDPGLVQITFCEGGWSAKQLDNGKLSVIHHLIVDPAGMAPAWIVNRKTVDDPIKTFKSLKARVNDPKYQGKSFSLLSAE